jgi:D-serine deaminase-like pyridoxal phosphate-dependent protein
MPMQATPDEEDRALDELMTPAAVVDLDRMAANLDRLAAYAADHGLSLRPHVKTHKAPWIAAEQRRRGAVGVTVATPREAHLMATVADDILVAYPTANPARTRALLTLPAHVRLTVALDSVDALRQLSELAKGTGRHVDVLVEVDLGMHRCGVARPAETVDLARSAAELSGVGYRGLMFYPGHIRQPVADQTDQREGLNRDLAGHLAALEDAGLPPAVVSGGSTPTWASTHQMPGVTEFRPGTYVFNDRITAELGACGLDDCAYTILATVISTAVPGQAVVDAGTKTLSGDQIAAPGKDGYGIVLGHPEVTVSRRSEEHGILDLSHTDWRPRVGQSVRIIPNHVCVSVNLQPKLWGIRDGRVVSSWANEARGWEP